MKKIRCLFRHKFLKAKNITSKEYENDNEVIRVVRCNLCNETVATYTVCVRSKAEECFIEE